MVIAAIVAGAGCAVIAFVVLCCCIAGGQAERMAKEKEDLDV